eukprot:scaffold2611_cov74-Skeletonema_dohrnii-CCMP3373.AAC.1
MGGGYYPRHGSDSGNGRHSASIDKSSRFATCECERKKVRQKGLFVSGIFFSKKHHDLLQENQHYSSNPSFRLTSLTIPYSQLDGGGSDVNDVSRNNDYGHYRKFMMMMMMYTMTIQIFQEINHIPNLTETCATTVVAMNNQNFQ